MQGHHAAGESFSRQLLQTLLAEVLQPAARCASVTSNRPDEQLQLIGTFRDCRSLRATTGSASISCLQPREALSRSYARDWRVASDLAMTSVVMTAKALKHCGGFRYWAFDGKIQGCL